MFTSMLFRRKSVRSIPPNQPLPIFARCICDRVFKPENDMETYCSSACARSDSLRALSGGDTLYRRKALQAQNSDNPPDIPQQRPRPRALPQRPPSPTTPPPPKHYQRYPLHGVRPLPPLPNGRHKGASPVQHREPARDAPAPMPEVAPREPDLPTTRGTTPIPGGTSNFASPYGVSSGRTYTRVAKKSTPSRPPLPIGHKPAKGSSRTPKDTPQKQEPPNTSIDRVHPQGSRQAREATSRTDKREVRKSASTSFLREAGSLWTKVPADLRHAEPMPLPPGVPQTKPLQVRPRAKAASPSAQGPFQQDTGYNTERKLRHSKSFNPRKPSYVADVPEDVRLDSPIDNPDEVWFVVRCLRGVEEEDYKMRLLSRQTQRW